MTSSRDSDLQGNPVIVNDDDLKLIVKALRIASGDGEDDIDREDFFRISKLGDTFENLESSYYWVAILGDEFDEDYTSIREPLEEKIEEQREEVDSLESDLSDSRYEKEELERAVDELKELLEEEKESASRWMKRFRQKHLELVKLKEGVVEVEEGDAPLALQHWTKERAK